MKVSCWKTMCSVAHPAYSQTWKTPEAPSHANMHLKRLLSKGATLGANATIRCGITIGKQAFIGAGAVVTRDVPDHALVYGNPAVQKGWVCHCGGKLNDRFQCEECGSTLEHLANK